MPWAALGAGKIWEFLRSELEMDGRFKTLESKLNLIQDNLKVSAAAACPICRSGSKALCLVEQAQGGPRQQQHWRGLVWACSSGLAVGL